MKRLFLWLIAFYQKAVSPHLPSACRYTPTCSEYTRIAIERWGAWHGAIMGLKRILRCHPFHKGGYDPPPDYPQSYIRRNEPRDQSASQHPQRYLRLRGQPRLGGCAVHPAHPPAAAATGNQEPQGHAQDAANSTATQ